MSDYEFLDPELDAAIIPACVAERDSLGPTQPWVDASVIEQSVYQTAYNLAALRLGHHSLISEQEDVAALHAETVDDLESLAFFHEVSGLPNKRAFLKELDERIAKDEPLAVAFLDLDKFKKVNDTHGHVSGDRVLKDAGQIIQDSIVELTYHSRADDFIAHFSGDEFGFILDLHPRACKNLTNEERMAAVKVKITNEIYKYAVEHDMDQLGLGVSIGIVEYKSGMQSQDVIGLADKAMYEHKVAKGRQTS